ncbi:MAG: DUF3553 domain-containing protein [Deltaproteobacteria bacterium]|jgi:hypothetical protein|nr:DUF3553 domain-containing protein [Deltaproteobacteria bacterium]
MRGIRQFLRLGDRVWQDYREDWGNGVVVEVMTSTIIGGTCLVRIIFEDGHQRTFNNDLNSEMCCARMGMCREHVFGRGRDRSGSRRPVTRQVTAAGLG